VVCLFLVKTALLLRLPHTMVAAVFILMCVLSRWSLVFVMRGFPYARREGAASAFIGTPGYKGIMFSTVIAAYLAWGLLGVAGFVVMASAAGCSVIVASWAGRKFGGITGDVLGAALELTEVFVLFAAPIFTAVLA
jgi:adenosylcobinamide-GDP ribazoletransferase